ncbi:hypothetical protein AX774_g8150 [Zancudomyces culisetae]|uniref:SUN domain-containing protein n=1 Tax=Zancudomyces culisetae TaxID=1213189 RepID=A0A1R1PBX4_ZANCU|nr:hypothetical protein AX774_g8150 [Zancudomyces culisetae]|eukprot:OMH78466.1 hypothetical protein AX774_g8150 [Zancudomyces culisetae]
MNRFARNLRLLGFVVILWLLALSGLSVQNPASNFKIEQGEEKYAQQVAVPGTPVEKIKSQLATNTVEIKEKLQNSTTLSEDSVGSKLLDDRSSSSTQQSSPLSTPAGIKLAEHSHEPQKIDTNISKSTKIVGTENNENANNDSASVEQHGENGIVKPEITRNEKMHLTSSKPGERSSKVEGKPERDGLKQGKGDQALEELEKIQRIEKTSIMSQRLNVDNLESRKTDGSSHEAPAEGLNTNTVHITSTAASKEYTSTILESASEQYKKTQASDITVQESTSSNENVESTGDTLVCNSSNTEKQLEHEVKEMQKEKEKDNPADSKNEKESTQQQPKSSWLSRYDGLRNEHFCPVTEFKVYGTTQIEKYRYEAEEEMSVIDAPSESIPNVYITRSSLGHDASSSLNAYMSDFEKLVIGLSPDLIQKQIDAPHSMLDVNKDAPKVGNEKQGSDIEKDEQSGYEEKLQYPAGLNEDIPTGTIQYVSPLSALIDMPQLKLEKAKKFTNTCTMSTDAPQLDKLQPINKVCDGAGGTVLNSDDMCKNVPADVHKQENKPQVLPLEEKNAKKNPSSPQKNGSESHPSVAAGPELGSAPGIGNGSEDSIFKKITLRLMYLERNMTLALNFLNNQSDSFNEILTKVQISNFDHLNRAVYHLNRSTTRQVKSLVEISEEIWRTILFDVESYQQQNRDEFNTIYTRIDSLSNELAHERRVNFAQLAILVTIVLIILLNQFVRAPTITNNPLSNPPSLAARAASHDPYVYYASDTKAQTQTPQPSSPTPTPSILQFSSGTGISTYSSLEKLNKNLSQLFSREISSPLAKTSALNDISELLDQERKQNMLEQDQDNDEKKKKDSGGDQEDDETPMFLQVPVVDLTESYPPEIAIDSKPEDNNMVSTNSPEPTRFTA